MALDPGVSTFQTCYDADGHVTEWGVDDMRRVFVLCRMADPTFETSRMAARRQANGRTCKLNGKTARAMCTWAHDRFRERLQAKAALPVLPRG